MEMSFWTGVGVGAIIVLVIIGIVAYKAMWDVKDLF
jgi:hypothetical protein